MERKKKLPKFLGMVNMKITASDRNINANIILFLKNIVFIAPFIVKYLFHEFS